MKKMKIKRTVNFALLLLLLVCGSSWAANFSFIDTSGYWYSGSDFSITIDWSDGWAITTVQGASFQGAGPVEGNLNTNNLIKSYTLDAGSISNGNGDNGPEIKVIDNPFIFNNEVVGNGNDTFFVAWDLGSKTVMLYNGDPLGNCYSYLGLDFSGDLSYSLTSETSMTFTSSSVEAIVGQRCSSIEAIVGQRFSSVPIPAAVWLLSSGLFGLVCIRRRSKSC